VTALQLSRRTRLLGIPGLVAAVLVLTACGGHSSLSPSDALAQAKRHLDTTSGVHITLTSDNVPSGVTAPSKADGVLTHARAFQGSITVPVMGISASIGVIALGDKVWAKLPFTFSYQQIDPAKYGVPDPAGLLDPHTGISNLLAESTGVKAGSSHRGGTDNKTVLTEYDATVPGADVAHVIPGATGPFRAAYTIDDSGDLDSAALTGHFAGTSHPAFTYTVTLSDYGTHQDITAP
jgi:lipoprotein LprG